MLLIVQTVQTFTDKILSFFGVRQGERIRLTHVQGVESIVQQMTGPRGVGMLRFV